MSLDYGLGTMTATTYFGGNDCLPLELNDYKKSVAKLFLKTLYNLALHI